MSCTHGSYLQLGNLTTVTSPTSLFSFHLVACLSFIGAHSIREKKKNKVAASFGLRWLVALQDDISAVKQVVIIVYYSVLPCSRAKNRV